MASRPAQVAGDARKATYDSFRKLPEAAIPSSGLCAYGSPPPPGCVAGAVEGVSGQHLLVVEHPLGEGLAACVGLQISSEAKGLVDWQLGLHRKDGGAGHLRLL